MFSGVLLNGASATVVTQKNVVFFRANSEMVTLAAIFSSSQRLVCRDDMMSCVLPRKLAPPAYLIGVFASFQKIPCIDVLFHKTELAPNVRNGSVQ